MNRETSPARVAPVDYVGRWREIVRARADQGERLDEAHGRGDHWAGPRAERFRRLTTAGGPDPLAELIRPVLTPETTVLDVGAGAGRHVVRIAPLVRKVTAVEPSPAMREQLGQVVREAALTNVEIVAGGWPGVDVPPADVVLCSHVAYFVADIAPFIERLRAVNRGRAFVVHRHVQREQAILDLFEKVWHEPRCFEPTFTDLFGVATQLGLWANVAKIPFGGAPTYGSLDDAIEMVRADLLNPRDPRATEIIREDLSARLIEREGNLTIPSLPTFAGVLWWEAGA